MTSHKLDNLVKIGQLKAEPGSQPEFDGLFSGEVVRTASRLAEMQTLHYLQQPHHAQRVTLGGDA